MARQNGYKLVHKMEKISRFLSHFSAEGLTDIDFYYDGKFIVIDEIIDTYIDSDKTIKLVFHNGIDDTAVETTFSDYTPLEYIEYDLLQAFRKKG